MFSVPGFDRPALFYGGIPCGEAGWDGFGAFGIASIPAGQVPSVKGELSLRVTVEGWDGAVYFADRGSEPFDALDADTPRRSAAKVDGAWVVPPPVGAGCRAISIDVGDYPRQRGTGRWVAFWNAAPDGTCVLPTS